MQPLTSPPLSLAPALTADRAPSPTLEINERVRALWAAGESVLHLGFGEARFPVHEKVAEALRASAHEKSYLSSQGLLSLREAVAWDYARNLGVFPNADSVIIAPGSKLLLFALQLALDAHLVLPTPSWVSYAPQAALLGRPVQWIPASSADGYALDPDAVARTLDGLGPLRQAQGTKGALLLLNSPNNPTGQMLDALQLDALAAICRERGVWVASDEIYAKVAHGARPHLSMAQFYPEGTIVLGGLSKWLSLGGWRVGTALVPATDAGATLMHALVRIASETWSCVAAPIQHAALAAYADDPAIGDYANACTAIHAARTRFLWRALIERGVDCPEPHGAFYLFPSFDRWREALAARGVRTSDELAVHLLDACGIATLPGSAFGCPPHDLALRLSTGYIDLETGEQAAAMVAAFRDHGDAERLLRERHPNLHEVVERLGAWLAGMKTQMNADGRK